MINNNLVLYFGTHFTDYEAARLVPGCVIWNCLFSVSGHFRQLI